MANDKSYYEVGKGTTTYHPFSISKRSRVYLEIAPVGKKVEKVGLMSKKMSMEHGRELDIVPI